MKGLQLNTKLEEFAILYKGVDPQLFKSMSSLNKKNFVEITLKETAILAETGKAGAGRKIFEILSRPGPKLTSDELLDINALIEFGQTLDQLESQLKKEARKFEIRQELNHFSRIMGLDKIISGSKLLPLDKSNALDQCKDFSRFIWLTLERRNEKAKCNYQLKSFPARVDIVFTNNTARINHNRENNFSVLLFSKPSESLSDKIQFSELTKIMAKFISNHSMEMAIGLFDYYLFLTQAKLKINLIVAQEGANLNNQSTIKILATSGSFLATETNLENFTNSIRINQNFTKLTNGGLGLVNPCLINQSKFNISSKASQVFIFTQDSPLSKLGEKRLLNVINSKDKKGKIIPTNNIYKFNQKTKESNLFGVLKCGNKNISKSLKSKLSVLDGTNLPISQNILKAKKVVIEAAHLHADRNPSQTQFDTAVLRNTFIRKLKSEGFTGVVDNILMIDDYHVVNRLDYKKYVVSLERKKFIPDFVILESSPVIRAVAIEVLKKLIKLVPGKLEIKGGNLYLKISQSKVIELIESFGNKDVIGCVLFDAAFSLFKKDIRGTNSIFVSLNPNNFRKTDFKILSYYLEETDPIRRRVHIKGLLSPIPDFRSLVNDCGNTPLLKNLERVKNVEVVNIHEIFYQPQQAKVNALLKLINEPSITTAYLNPQANDVLIECSALFG